MEATRHDATPRDLRAFAVVQTALTGGFLVVLFGMLGGTDGDPPPLGGLATLGGLLVLTTVLAERVWLGTEALDPAEDGQELTEIAIAVFAGQSARKLLLCEVPLIAAVVATFALDAAAWPILLIGAPGLAVLAFEVWPSLRNLAMTATMLEARGARSGLVEAFI